MLQRLIFLFLLLSVSVIAQKPLSNDDVVDMLTVGLSGEIVAAKIRSSETRFDTSTDALKKLAEKKVPDVVILAMIEQEQKTKQIQDQQTVQANKAIDAIPEQGKLSDLVSMKKV